MSKSKADLTKEVEELSKELGVEVVIAKDATVADIQKKLDELKKKQETREAKAKEDEELEKAAADQKPKFEFYVAPGKSITSKVGVIGPLGEVKASYLANGKKDLTALLKRKVVLKG